MPSFIKDTPQGVESDPNDRVDIPNKKSKPKFDTSNRDSHRKATEALGASETPSSTGRQVMVTPLQGSLTSGSVAAGSLADNGGIAQAMAFQQRFKK